jgi:hypothetical protein
MPEERNCPIQKTHAPGKGHEFLARKEQFTTNVGGILLMRYRSIGLAGENLPADSLCLPC